jgi:hypothetical protein
MAGAKQLGLALQRVVDIEFGPGWEAACIDYWVLKNPDLAPFRGMDAARLPAVTEMVRLAGLVRESLVGVPREWQRLKDGKERAKYRAQVAWFHEASRSLYGPVGTALRDLRRGDTSRIEVLIRFLEADPFCHRSGYVKADVINSLTRLELDRSQRDRLRAVLFEAVKKPALREFRKYIRLARYLDDTALRSDLATLAQSSSEPGARNASWVLRGLPPT